VDIVVAAAKIVPAGPERYPYLVLRRDCYEDRRAMRLVIQVNEISQPAIIGIIGILLIVIAPGS
jgi:hypothetical protein